MADTSRPLRLAVVGCGAVTRANLMPVLAGHDRVRVIALVDRSRERADQLAAAYSISRVETDVAAVVDDVDGVILATPPAHHAPATIELAGRGKHVFVEKPMAITRADAEAMVAAASAAGVVLSVGLYRRMLPSVRLLRTLVAAGEYGRPLSVDAEEGGPYGWRLASLDVLTRAAGGGGVLIDIGSHVLDVLLHALPGAATLDRYEDNTRGGIETDCIARFSVAHHTGVVPVRVELSRTRELRGSIRIECERATLELQRADFTQVLVHARRSSGPSGQAGPGGSAGPVRTAASWSGQGSYVGYQAFRDEIDDWLSAIANRAEPILSGRSVVPVVGLIEDCYQNRSQLPEPWVDEGLHPGDGPGSAEGGPGTRHVTVGSGGRRRVLITGAGGFLGGRATELLSERYGWDVVALVREPKSAARLARWPRQIVLGDVCSRADMDRAMKGCEAVVHCAVGTGWPPDHVRRVTIEGTKTAAEAALAARVSRFVHISTLFVHRRGGTAVMDETAPLDPGTDRYGQAKLEAERALETVAKQGLSTIVLRPARIYGPFSQTFTIRPLQAISDGRFALRGNPDVPANMVYVDNVVEAIARALEVSAGPSAPGYLVSDAEQVSLREFYEYFAAAAGSRGIRLLPESPDGTRPPAPGLAGRWLGGLRAIATSPELRGIVRRVIQTDPIGTLPRKLWDLSPAVQQSLLRRFGADAAVVYRPTAGKGEDLLVYYGEPARVSIQRAQADLGYTSLVPRERAMALTLEWARAARLLPGGSSGDAEASLDERRFSAVPVHS